MLRVLGGEWAGWRCAFNAAGVLVSNDIERFCSDTMIEYGQVPKGFEICSTEHIVDGGKLSRRTVQFLPEDGCASEDLAAIVTRQISVRSAQSCIRASTYAIDEVDEAGLWRCETIFAGLGGARPRARANALPGLAERTRVALTFDASAGTLAREVLVWQERLWAADAGVLQVREGGSRVGIDAAWLSSAVGIGCFGETTDAVAPLPAASSETSGFALALPGGVEVRGAAGVLDVALGGDGGRICLRRGAFDAGTGACMADLVEQE